MVVNMALKGIKQTEEHKRKRSESMKRKFKECPEFKEKIINAIKLQHKENPNYGMKGKKHSEETKTKIKVSHIEKVMSEEHKKNWKNSMDKLREEGKLVAWNKGLTPRVGKYKSNSYKVHKTYCSYTGNHPYVPKGMVIHHINLNPNDNSKNNLLMIDGSSHNKLHNKLCLLMRDGGLIK